MWTGGVRTGLAVVLAEHLILNPHSRVGALKRGDIRWKDWTPEAEILASQFDQVGMIAAAFSGKKDVSDFEDRAYPRPGESTSEVAEVRVPTIAEFSEAAFGRFMYG